jgi:hypothetical protein
MILITDRMIIKNPEKLLKQFIPSATGNLIWCVTDVNVTMDDEITYVFKFQTQVPVKSSPNQQYYSMTRSKNVEAKLNFYRVQHENTYELFCYGQVQRGYSTDIDTMDKFIDVLRYMLPNTY